MGISAGIAYPEKFTTSAASHTTSVGQATQATGSAFLLWEVGGGGITTLSTPTDNKGNTYTAGAAQVTSAGGAKCRWWYIENGAGGAGHTWTFPSTGSDIRSVFVLEIKGGALSGILDQAPAGIADATSPYTSNTTGTTAQANEMIVAMVATDTVSGTETITWGGGFAQSMAIGDATFVTGGLGTQISSATGTFTSSITSSGAGTTGVVSFVASFKEAAGGGSTFTVVAADTVTLSSTAVSVTTRPKTSSDTLTLTDSVVTVSTRPKTASDTLTLTDSATRISSRLIAATDTVSLSDQAIGALVSTRTTTASDTLSLSDAASCTNSAKSAKGGSGQAEITKVRPWYEVIGPPKKAKPRRKEPKRLAYVEPEPAIQEPAPDIVAPAEISREILVEEAVQVLTDLTQAERAVAKSVVMESLAEVSTVEAERAIEEIDLSFVLSILLSEEA